MTLLISNYGGLMLLLHLFVVIILGGIYEVLKQIKNKLYDNENNTRTLN